MIVYIVKYLLIYGCILYLYACRLSGDEYVK